MKTASKQIHHSKYKGPEWQTRCCAEKAILDGLDGWAKSVKEWPRKSVCEIVRDFAHANTYRAFTGIEKPSRVFRTWGWTFVSSGGAEELARCPEDFDKQHSHLVKDLRECWACIVGAPLPYGPATKLLNLLILHTCQCHVEVGARERILDFLHVPLDEYVLRAIRNCINEDPPARIPIELGPHPSMGAIKCETEYQAIQDWIRALTLPLAAPPIILNYLAWELPHRATQKHAVEGRGSVKKAESISCS